MTLIEKIYEAESNKSARRALDVMFSNVDELLREGKFDDVNDLIKDIDLSRLSTTSIVGLLGITLPAYDKLLYRATLANDAETEFRKRGESEVRIKNLLKRLR